MSVNSIDKTTGALNKIAGLYHSQDLDDVMAAMPDSASSSNKLATQADVGTITDKTLAANATSIEFDVPTTGDHLIEFFSSDGANFTAIDTSVSGKVTLTYEAVASARTITCRIAEG